MQKTINIFTWNLYAFLAVFFLPGTKSGFYVSYEIDSYYRILNTAEGYITALRISYSNDSV